MKQDKITDQNCIELVCSEDDPYLGDFNWRKGIKYFKFRDKYYKYEGWEMFLTDAKIIK